MERLIRKAICSFIVLISLLFTESLVFAVCSNCRSNLGYPSSIFYDTSGDTTGCSGGCPELDLLSGELLQISDDSIQLKISVNGDPHDLEAAQAAQYAAYFDTDNDGTEDFNVRIGYDTSYSGIMRGSINSYREGTMDFVPFLLTDSAVYARISLIPYRDSYSVSAPGQVIKLKRIESGDISGVHDYYNTTSGQGNLVRGSNLIDPGFEIQVANEIFPNSPHSMYLDYGQLYNLSVQVNMSQYQDCVGNVEFFSNNEEIAEIVNVSNVKTNYDIMTSEEEADKSVLLAYLADCDMLVDDFVIAMSGKELLKHGKAAYVVPTQRYDGSVVPYHWVQIKNILVQYEAARISDLALDIQEYLVGKIPYDGVNRLTGYNPPAPGWAGQPIWHGLCSLIWCEEDKPHWDTHYHEIGHTMTTHIFSNSGNSRFAGFRNRAITNGNRYSEGMATLNGMYTIYTLTENPDEYGLTQNILNSLNDFNNFFRNVYVDQKLSDYLNNVNFINVDPDVLDGMFIHLAENEASLNPCGWEIYPRFYRVFLPMLWDIDTQVVSDGSGETETFFVAALSAAAITSGGSDLRYLFETEWGFPINSDYTTIRADLVNKLNSITPTLSASPSSFSFTAYQGEPAPDCQILDIRNNAGGGTLIWSVSDNQNWLSLIPQNGSSTCDTDEVAVCVNHSGLSANNYSGTITISSNGGNTTIPVSLSVHLPPGTVISPNGGEIWGMSESHTILWEPGEDADYVTIQYKPASVWKTIVTNTSNDGSYNWYISNNSADCSSAVKVRIVPDVGPSDESNGNFTIDCYPSLQLSEPTINGRTLTLNGGTSPRCGSFDMDWCSENTCGANPNTGPFMFTWGDGGTSCSYFPCSHTYATPGTYTIAVNVTNTCGLTASRSTRCDICHGQVDKEGGYVTEKTIQVTIP